MAGNSDSGEKTEKATPKKLRDARKKGDVSKSRDITSTLGLIFSFGILWLVFNYASTQISWLLQVAITSPGEDFAESLRLLGSESLKLFLQISAAILIPIAVFGVLVEFLQIGPILTAEKMKPKMSNLDPAAGIKRMFGMDNFVEVIKSVIKTSILFFIGWMTISAILPQLVYLPTAGPLNLTAAFSELVIYLFSWTFGVFLLLTVLDASYQKYSYAKKMKMSMHDIKQEYKDTEGDPLIKGQRQQTAQEWAQEGASQAASDASVLVVNPTHVAIAINYDRDVTPVPTVMAKGEDETARSMREAAERANVPVLRNKQLARTLLADAEMGEPVPRELFDIIAEVILWAAKVRERVEHERENRLLAWDGKIQAPPGEDLTTYPEGGGLLDELRAESYIEPDPEPVSSSQ